MTALRPLSPDDGPDVYALLQSIPAEENGLMNAAHGMDFEQYRAWLRAQYESARQVGLRDGYKVPQTTYWLVADGRPVGLGRLRHFLTAALREDGGNLAYAVAHETFESVAGWLVPELQRRGVYRTAYTPGTLRHQLFGKGDRLSAPHPGASYRDLGARRAAGRVVAE